MTDLISNNDKTRSRGWCFTINNPTEEDENFAYNLAWGAKYTICGREIAPETGTIHLQGYVYFENPKFFTAIKALHPAAHWEAAKGTPAQNQVYCSKDGDYFEWGTPPMTQEQKGDVNAERWDLALKAVQENRWEDVPTDIGARYGKGLEWFANKIKPNNLEDTEESMYWYYGGPGTGKSRKAREDNPEAYIKMCNKWWDDYKGEEVVIIEDFDKAHNVLCHHLKIWADRYKFPAEYKGGKMDIRPKKIIITSNYHPSDIWTEDKDLGPIMRRFTCVKFGETPFNMNYTQYANTFNKL